MYAFPDLGHWTHITWTFYYLSSRVALFVVNNEEEGVLACWQV